MSRKERRITAMILALMAVCSALWIHYVLWKEQPENIAAFRGRFAAVDSLGWTADDAVALTISPDRLTAAWQEGDGELVIETGIQPAAGDRLRVNASVGGTYNAIKRDRWGFRVWMTLQMCQGEQVIRQEEIELPLESSKNRERVYAIEASADGADGYRVRLRVEPIDGTVAQGQLNLEYWEVYAQ